MRAIIADDSELLRERIRALLKPFVNVEVVGEAADGRTVVRMVKDLAPDLVILDIRMPELNGIETLKEIRKNGSRATICVLTNYPYPQYRDRCYAEGADYFFDKNSDFQKITSMIIELTAKITGAEHV
jgi:DNA-binding NarL/FixJ family response regulator